MDKTTITAESEGRSVAILEPVRWLLLAAILAFLFMQLFSQHQSAASFPSVSDSVIHAADLSSMKESDNQMLRRVFGMNAADYEGVTYYAPLSNMDVTEILVVKLSDLSQQDAVKTAMEARVSSQISVFEGYAPEQTALLQHAVVLVKGNYLLLVVAENTAPVVSAFENAL